ncbi:MAG: hypothetical protein ACRDOI_20490 [Trebonia sp.]
MSVTRAATLLRETSVPLKGSSLHVTRAPWGITTLVSCLPVLVLGMGTALAHMLREDAAAADQPDQDQPVQVRDQPDKTKITARASPSPGTRASGRVVSRSRDQEGVQASLIALRLVTAGKPVSRRALRNGGVKGSNESLNALARQLNAEFAGEQAAVPEEAPGGADEREADGERAGQRRTRRAPRAVPPPGGIPPGN